MLLLEILVAHGALPLKESVAQHCAGPKTALGMLMPRCKLRRQLHQLGE